MAELIVLVVIGVGLYKRGGRRFEWSRRSLKGAAEGAVAGGERWLTRGLRALPAIAGQCIVDMRALGDDLMGLIDPKARARIEERARGVMARAERHAQIARPSGTRLATAGRPAGGAYETLQKSYLEGAITLERYVEEAERLRPRR